MSPTPRVSTQGLGLPGHRAPGAGLEEPFEMLSACHERVERMLGLMQRLRQHLSDQGWDTQAAQAARDVMRYFDLAAPLHHQDEELHVFPALLAAPDTGLHAVVRQLQQDHRDMAHNWSQARLVLDRVATHGHTAWAPLTPPENTCLDRFAGVYARHIDAENTQVYPAAQRHLTPADRHRMSEDMMVRRGVTPVTSR